MADSGSEEPPQGITSSQSSFWQLTRMFAVGTSWNLNEGWKRPVQHNIGLERLALWHTVNLDLKCEEAAYPNGKAFSLMAAHFEPDARFEITAAVLHIPEVVPFAFERDKLRYPIAARFEEWGEEMAAREPHTVARWHEWIWEQASGSLSPEDHGSASILAVAARHLADALGTGVGSAAIDVEDA